MNFGHQRRKTALPACVLKQQCMMSPTISSFLEQFAIAPSDNNINNVSDWVATLEADENLFGNETTTAKLCNQTGNQIDYEKAMEANVQQFHSTSLASSRLLPPLSPIDSHSLNSLSSFFCRDHLGEDQTWATHRSH
jgi:hypothetical protein